MKITLLHYTPLDICSHAIRTCWQSFDKSDNGGEIDKALIDRVGNKYKHSSTLEHLSYSFYIQGISRACLQELARHRIASLSVKSSRYTLKELMKEEVSFFKGVTNKERIEKYIVLTNDERVNHCSIQALENLRMLVRNKVSNDIVKYAMPECYKTELTWTINARSLQNFLSLRNSNQALWEIRQLASEIYSKIPATHKFIFEKCVENS
ncbi:FAD-dependent thymidylate synthase [Helicobacter sp. 23-1045]